MTLDLLTTQRNLILNLQNDLTRAHHAMVVLDTRHKHKALVLTPCPTHKHATRTVLLTQHGMIRDLQDDLFQVQTILVDMDTPLRPPSLDEVVMDAHVAVDETNFGHFEA